MADFNRDSWITFNELVTYIIPAASSNIQTPGYASLAGHEQGEFLFYSPKTRQTRQQVEKKEPEPPKKADVYREKTE